MTRLLIVLIRLYQLMVSGWLGPCCRFYPSCSTYAMEALRTHGLWKGLVLSLQRIGRCHPWNDGGLDPVPGRRGEEGIREQ